MNDTYTLIKVIISELIEQHRRPLYVPFTDLVKRSNKCREDVINDIQRLSDSGKIRVRNSLNDELIQLL